ncbi:MAG: hypothetical protein D4S01_10800 [Dehalococcoidia bacterium]|nr:MAG: hypothetical protein D4S01_10800 [Dehalococcoidia bacterium]
MTRDEKIEIAARKLCDLRGIDPDKVINHSPGPDALETTVMECTICGSKYKGILEWQKACLGNAGIPEEIHIEAVKLGDEFWSTFSSLCDETLDRLSDQEYRDWFEIYLGDKTSIFGRKRKYLR